jgi:hypothetical protein
VFEAPAYLIGRGRHVVIRRIGAADRAS